MRNEDGFIQPRSGLEELGYGMKRSFNSFFIINSFSNDQWFLKKLRANIRKSEGNKLSINNSFRVLILLFLSGEPKLLRAMSWTILHERIVEEQVYRNKFARLNYEKMWKFVDR